MRPHDLLLPLVALALGCGDPPAPARFPVTFQATSDPGVPLADVAITANGMPLGATLADGSLHVELTGAEGSPVQIGATCPEGHRPPATLPVITLRRVVGLDPSASAPALRVSVACAPSIRHGVLLVRAAGDAPRGDLPVIIDGREVARTDASGVAHVALDLAPGARFQVLLATATTALRPRDPGMSFVMPDADEIFVFDQPFQVPVVRTPRRVPRPQRPPPPVHTGPIRIVSGRGARGI